MRLLQYRDGTHEIRAALVEGGQSTVRPIEPAVSTYELAIEAIRTKSTLQQAVSRRTLLAPVDYDSLIEAGAIISPLLHPDPRHCLVSMTGLTHLGGAAARDQMHKAVKSDPEVLTDSLKMFKLGLEGGKPAAGEIGMQPEWCYKSDGALLVSPWADLPCPDFALNMGEEPELAGLYVIGDDGDVFRLGFALGNEFSDHRTERINYLYLGHSKLRPSSIGPELVVGDFPSSLTGTSRIRRNAAVAWERPFLTGTENMCHSLENIEYHHFKYSWHRRPGDVHVHFLGTATISFADGFELRDGDVMEIEAPGFGRPLVNRVVVERTYAPSIRNL
ncbi:MAG: GguC protein [Bradyrhizobiaceae bacterium]|nr:GguC protein [Bradyrhizobiaceae bacterium]